MNKLLCILIPSATIALFILIYIIRLGFKNRRDIIDTCTAAYFINGKRMTRVMARMHCERLYKTRHIDADIQVIGNDYNYKTKASCEFEDEFKQWKKNDTTTNH